jgi:uncharacterized membrane protein YkoI
MSGGHFDYKEYQAKELMDELAHEVKKDSTVLAKMIKEIGMWVYAIAHELDYHYSGDTTIKNWEKLEIICLKRLKTIVKKMEK